MPAVVGVTVVEPLAGSEPVQAPLAVQLAVLSDDQVSVALCPATTVDGWIVSVSGGGGGGAELPPYPPPQPTTRREVRATTAVRVRFVKRGFNIE
ncbi:MAG: hypothetical protein JSR54_00525 [Proteobacteria bacterium]|nr:hypothetical protein [Pseudomonadota bacterium]